MFYSVAGFRTDFFLIEYIAKTNKRRCFLKNCKRNAIFLLFAVLLDTNCVIKNKWFENLMLPENSNEVCRAFYCNFHFNDSCFKITMYFKNLW